MNLTIVTACWKADNIPKVIESVNNQTFKGWEHILINDNNESVRDVFNEVKEERNRQYIDMKVRTHYYGGIARNIGVMTAFSYVHHSKRDIENEWVVFHDDDNLWEPDHLETLIEAINTNPEATMAISDAIWVGAKDKSYRRLKKCQLRHGGCDLGQFMYKTKLFKEYGYFDPHPRSKHKYDWRLIEKMVTGEKDRLVYTNKPTFIMNYKKI